MLSFHHPGGSIHIGVLYTTHTSGAGQYTPRTAVHSTPVPTVETRKEKSRGQRGEKVLKDYLVQALHLERIKQRPKMHPASH